MNANTDNSSESSQAPAAPDTAASAQPISAPTPASTAAAPVQRRALLPVLLGAGLAALGLGLGLRQCTHGKTESKGQQPRQDAGDPDDAGAATSLKQSSKFTPKGLQKALSEAKLQDIHGKRIDFAQYADKPLVLNFWATWCPPCLQELPLLINQYHAKDDKKFYLLPIAVDDVLAARSLWQRKQWLVPTAVAGYNGIELMKKLGIKGADAGKLPYTVLLDAEGKLLTQHVGALKEAQITQLYQLAEGGKNPESKKPNGKKSLSKAEVSPAKNQK